MLNLLLYLPLLAPLAQDDSPQLFRDLSLDAAIEAASKERKIVVLDAMTSWCSPCRQMERTTWRDPALVPWLSDRAVCIKLDMDEHLDVKRRLGIRGYPTLVAFRGGVAFDQILGYKSAAQVRAWVEGLERGTTDSQRLLQRIEVFRNMRTEEINFEDRRAVAESLLDHGHDQAAGEELLWLWDNIPLHAPQLAAWRWDVLPGELAPLVGQLESVNTRISNQRLALRPQKGRLPSITKLRDWIELNTMLGDDIATAIFCGAALEVDSGRRLIRKLDHRLFPLLVAHDDWRAAGLILDDPIRQARVTLSALDAPLSHLSVPEAALSTRSEAPSRDAIPLIPKKSLDPGRSSATSKAGLDLQIRRMVEKDVRSSLSTRYAALLAADRRREANSITDELFTRLDDDLSRISLVTQAISAGVAQKQSERHVRWLEEALR